jgi:SAM-dependent methyltransferase
MNNQTKANHLQDPPGAASKKDEIRQFFDDLSVGRNESIQENPVIRSEQELRAETVLGPLAVKLGERVLDIGCGNARDIARVAQCGGHVVGVDISAGMVAAAK